MTENFALHGAVYMETIRPEMCKLTGFRSNEPHTHGGKMVGPDKGVTIGYILIRSSLTAVRHYVSKLLLRVSI